MNQSLLPWPGILGLLMLCAAAGVPAAEEDAATAKADAVSRIIESHDPTLSVRIGRVYVKQAALRAARELLVEGGRASGVGAEWKLDHPTWVAAERELMEGIDALIERKVSHPAWVKQAWSESVMRIVSGEEADEIAVHFASEGGELQRRVIEWFVGELTLQTYTFTERLRYGVPGSEAEMRDLQQATYERAMLDRIYDLSEYPGALRFASRDPGVKYFKMMVTQGVHALHVHLETVAEEARRLIRSRADRADAHIARALGAARRS